MLGRARHRRTRHTTKEKEAVQLDEEGWARPIPETLEQFPGREWPTEMMQAPGADRLRELDRWKP